MSFLLFCYFVIPQDVHIHGVGSNSCSREGNRENEEHTIFLWTCNPEVPPATYTHILLAKARSCGLPTCKRGRGLLELEGLFAERKKGGGYEAEIASLAVGTLIQTPGLKPVIFSPHYSTISHSWQSVNVCWIEIDWAITCEPFSYMKLFLPSSLSPWLPKWLCAKQSLFLMMVICRTGSWYSSSFWRNVIIKWCTGPYVL